MNADRSEPRTWANGSWGGVLVLTGCAAMILAARLEYTPLGDNQDPGPRAFPLILGMVLLLGGLIELASTWRGRRSEVHQDNDRPASKAKAVDPMADIPGAEAAATPPSSRDALIVLVAVGVYVAALGWLGFSLSTVLLVMGLMLRLGARWLTAALTAVGLVVVVQLLFVQLFRVQLPVGTLGLPF